jgi:hypothetical protein
MALVAEEVRTIDRSSETKVREMSVECCVRCAVAQHSRLVNVCGLFIFCYFEARTQAEILRSKSRTSDGQL